MTAQEVLDTSVAQLETLAAFLHEQLAEGSDGPGRVTTETRACNEILRSLRALIPKVRTREGLAGWNPPRGWPVPYHAQHSKLESSSNRAECQPFLRSGDRLDPRRASGESI
jgi:hypothetical protein